MSRIIIPKAPNGPCPIRWDLGPIKRVVCAFDAIGYWYFSKTGSGKYSGSSLYYPTPYGVGRKCENDGIIIGDGNDVGTTGGGFIYNRMLTAGTGSAHGPGIRTATVSYRCSVHHYWNDTNIYWDYGGVGPGRVVVGSSDYGSEPLLRPTTWGFCSGPTRNLEVWKNGRRIASGGTAATRTASNDPFYDGKWDATGSGWTGYSGIYILFNQEPSYWFMNNLTANPYLVFADSRLSADAFNSGPVPYSYMNSYITWG